MSRPRHSILTLFDPLTEPQNPSTPPRTDSPNQDSDKENENPPRSDLTLTSFFNRTYKPYHPSVKPLRRRLVDVGDITVDHGEPDPWNLSDEDASSHVPDLEDVEDNENDTLTFRHIAESATPKWNTDKASSFKTPSPTAPRTPLSELSFDVDATPMARSKPHRRLPHAMRSKLAELDSPQFQLIVSNASPQRTVEPSGVDSAFAIFDEKELGTGNPSLPVSSNPLVNSVSSINLPSSSITGSLIRNTVFVPSSSISDDLLSSNSSFTRGHLRPNPPSTSSLDQSRCSVDLQSSFQLHFGDESHFDLLNDKVSFFGLSRNGGASYLDDDPSFDMAFEDGVPAPFPRFELPAAQSPTTDPLPSVASPPTAEVEAKTTTTQQVESTGVATGCSDLIEPLAPETPGPKIEKCETPQNSRTLPVPPPVAGLRIVKRTQASQTRPKGQHAVTEQITYSTCSNETRRATGPKSQDHATDLLHSAL